MPFFIQQLLEGVDGTTSERLDASHRSRTTRWGKLATARSSDIASG